MCPGSAYWGHFAPENAEKSTNGPNRSASADATLLASKPPKALCLRSFISGRRQLSVSPAVIGSLRLRGGVLPAGNSRASHCSHKVCYNTSCVQFGGISPMKAASRRRAPTTVKRTVRRGRRPNGHYRTREYLTEKEVERLIKAAGRNRYGHRDATMILLAFRHGLRASELCSLR